MKWLLLWIVFTPEGYFARVSSYAYDHEVSCLRAIEQQRVGPGVRLLCVEAPVKGPT